MKALVLAIAAVAAAGPSAFAQMDPGIQAAQQANQAAMQANQQAIDQAQRDAQAAADAAQRAADQAQRDAQNSPTVGMTRQPQFSAAAGRLPAGATIRITSPTHYAAIYYTTNGFTPTAHSHRYTGPISIDHDTVLQAIAIAPNMLPSWIARAEYSVGAAQSQPPQAITTDGVLRKGVRLRVATAAQLNSKTAQVGDKLPLVLVQDILAGDKVVVPKGARLEASITQADRAAHAGEPGDIVFEVQALQSSGVTIPLHGGETMQGEAHYKRAIGLVIIPVVGAAGLLAHGGEAVIAPGMTFSVEVSADTPLSPTTAAPALHDHPVLSPQQAPDSSPPASRPPATQDASPSSQSAPSS